MACVLAQIGHRIGLKFLFAGSRAKCINFAIIMTGIREFGLYFHATDEICFIGIYHGCMGLPVIMLAGEKQGDET
jgi:hypothetical protein